MRFVLLKYLVVVFVWTGFTGEVGAATSGRVWCELEPGLELARFDSSTREPVEIGDLIVLRVDPAKWEIKALTPDSDTRSPGFTVKQWCDSFDLVAAINAGMYQADHRTHVGFCQIEGRLANPSANDYLSVVAWGPLNPEDPPFRIFDLDEISLPEVARKYGTVVQNLRLIKRGRENRWQPSGDRWTEAALGEDGQGRALLIYCATPWSMYDFNEILLDLPLGLVAAQHLEGRTQARMWVVGPSLEEQPVWRKRLESGPVLPNIFGVVASPSDPATGDDDQ